MTDKVDLKIRVAAAKEKLPKAILPILVVRHPDIDQVKATAVLQLRAVDEDITVKIEKLAEEMKSILTIK